jgi:hypothetical protein
VEAVQYTDICIFAYMASANLFVQLIHSITSYHDHSGASPDLNEKSIRFMGDRVGPIAPMHVVIPPSLGWTPQEVGGVSDHLAWASFYADASNWTRFYVPGAEVATTTIKIPSLLHLLHILADFILSQPQTCINVFSKVLCLVATKDVGVDADAFKLVTDWLIAASYATSTSPNKSRLCFSIAVANLMNPYFQ